VSSFADVFLESLPVLVRLRSNQEKLRARLLRAYSQISDLLSVRLGRGTSKDWQGGCNGLLWSKEDFMAAAAVLARAPVPQAGVRVAKAILVVEDEAFVRNVTCNALAMRGHSVLWASGVVQAKTIFARHSGEIAGLLCDAVLPDGSGMLLARDLRNRSRNLKVVIVSGYPPALLGTARGEGEESIFLEKPYSCATLLAKIGELLCGNENASAQVA
jgi:CheY-like chemotaxis protein